MSEEIQGNRSKPVLDITLGDLLGGDIYQAMEITYWGNDVAEAADTLANWQLTTDDIEGVPVGEVERWYDPTHKDSFLIVRKDDGEVDLF